MTNYSKIINSVVFQALEVDHLKKMVNIYLEENYRENLPWLTVRALARLAHIKPEYFKTELLKTISKKQFLNFWEWFV